MNEQTFFYQMSQPILDQDHLMMLEELSDDQENMVFELTRIFRNTTPELLEQLAHAISHNERESIRRLAHRLKGSAANIGARQLAARCSLLEEIARSGLASIPIQCLIVVEEDFKATEQALTHWLANN